MPFQNHIACATFQKTAVKILMLFWKKTIFLKDKKIRNMFVFLWQLSNSLQKLLFLLFIF